MAELTDRMREVLQAVKDGQTPRWMVEHLGMSRSQVGTNFRKLVAGGWIVRRPGTEDLPVWTSYAQAYPWDVARDTPLPRLPAGARFREQYVTEGHRELSVPPVTHIQWDRWSVQGIPMLHPGGKHPRAAATPERVVVIHALSVPYAVGTWSTAFVASRQRPWTERNTRWIVDDADGDWYRAMTLVIAAVVGVDAVLDDPMSVADPHAGTGPDTEGGAVLDLSETGTGVVGPGRPAPPVGIITTSP